MKQAIAHFLYRPIKSSHSFIYNQIKHLTKYRSIVIGPFTKSENHYHFDEFYNLNHIKDFSAFVEQENIAAIHAHHGGESLMILPEMKQLNIPLIVSIRGRDGSAHPKAFQRNFSRYQELKNQAALFLPVCHYLAQDLQKLQFPEEKIKVLYGGIDLKVFQFHTHQLPREGEIRILSVGRLVAKKGFHTLIRAFAKVHKIYPQTTLHIIGEGGNEKRIRSLIAKLRLKKAVKLCGKMSTEDIAEELNNAHLFCLASQTASDGDVEGIPNALKEAMAAGLPVVSTLNGGIPELIEHKQTGFLAIERNPRSLAQGIKYFLDQPHLWGDYTKLARQKIETSFSLEKQLEVQEQIYEETINKRS